MEDEGTGENVNIGKIRVRVYFSKPDFLLAIDDAVQLKLRKGGLPPFIQRPHGFANQFNDNTDGISKMLKFCWRDWRENAVRRLEAAAEIAKQEKDLQERKRKLGL